MASKVNKTPFLSKPIGGITSFTGLTSYLVILIGTIVSELTDHAQRINGALMADGSEPMTGPIRLPSYVKAALPPATATGLIYVSNDTGGPTVAFADGTNWRRVQDRNVIS